MDRNGMAKQLQGRLFAFRVVMLNWLACCLVCRGIGNVVLRLPYKDLSTDPVIAGDYSRRLCKAGVRYGSRDHCPELRLTQASNPVETMKLTASYLVPQSEKFFFLPFPRNLYPLQCKFHSETLDVCVKPL
jgi:hypothetical protein